MSASLTLDVFPVEKSHNLPGLNNTINFHWMFSSKATTSKKYIYI